ncbi:MAG: DDE-type integrase/transposase/recombinase [Dehalococcoidales bacterium]|nr:DDE-type integrase/transposase/recombinase [Dehalococcoidales bacterium]
MKKSIYTEWDRGFIAGGREIIRMVNQEYFAVKCKLCGSAHVVRYRRRKGVQRWWCKTCKRKFVDNKAISGMKTPIEQVASAISMYYEGMSLNAIRRQFQQMHNYLPSDSTIYEWIDRFRQKAVDEANKQTPKVGDTFIADETVLRVGGKKYWLIDIMDADTRFFICSYISHNRSIRDIKAAFEKAYELTKKYPKTVVTDGWGAYPDGIEQAYGANTKHKLGSPFVTTDNNTNLIERVQGTVKDRTKVLRGLKTKETAEVLSRILCEIALD